MKKKKSPKDDDVVQVKVEFMAWILDELDRYKKLSEETIDLLSRTASRAEYLDDEHKSRLRELLFFAEKLEKHKEKHKGGAKTTNAAKKAFWEPWKAHYRVLRAEGH